MTEEARIIGAPSDYGANRRGVDMGPSAIRYAGLQDQLETAGVASVDVGDVTAPPAETQDADKRVPEEGRAKFVDEVEAVSHQVADEVAGAIEDGATPLVLGGDHSVAIGSLRGAAADADVGTVWFDAHADMNTPSTSPSGNVHGMPLAAALGRREFEGVEWATAPRLDPENVVWVGLRSVDDRENQIKGFAHHATGNTASPIIPVISDFHGQTTKQLGSRACIIQGTVSFLTVQSKLTDQVIKGVILLIQQDTSHTQGIDLLVPDGTGSINIQKPAVEIDIMSHENGVTGKVEEISEHRRNRRSLLDVRRLDTG